MLLSAILNTKFEKGNVIDVVCEVLMDNNLAHPDLFPGTECIIKSSEAYQPNQPVWLLSFFPIMDSQYDRESTGRQELLVIVVDAAVIIVIIVIVIVEETVRRSKRKSGANLRAIVCEVIYRIS